VKGLFTTGTLTRRLAANCFRLLVLSGEQGRWEADKAFQERKAEADKEFRHVR
jgi:hypothetical protein